MGVTHYDCRVPRSGPNLGRLESVTVSLAPENQVSGSELATSNTNKWLQVCARELLDKTLGSQLVERQLLSFQMMELRSGNILNALGTDSRRRVALIKALFACWLAFALNEREETKTNQ